MTVEASPDFLEQLSLLARDQRSALAALARREGVSPEDAVDCVQEALCSLLQRESSGALPLDVESWAALVASMVKNNARNRRRRHDRSRPHEPLGSQVLAAETVPSDEDLARAEEHVRLRGCVQSLCDTQRAVVTLRMLEEKPGEDVARALGISAGHVAVLLHRAKAKLLVCMTDAG